MSRAFTVDKRIGEKNRKICMHALSPPVNATPPQTLKMCGVSKWLSLGPKTRAWLRLQLLMKQTSGDCDGSNLEIVLYLK